jgi:hypothetical protein
MAYEEKEMGPHKEIKNNFCPSQLIRNSPLAGFSNEFTAAAECSCGSLLIVTAPLSFFLSFFLCTYVPASVDHLTPIRIVSRQ